MTCCGVDTFRNPQNDLEASEWKEGSEHSHVEGGEAHAGTCCCSSIARMEDGVLNIWEYIMYVNELFMEVRNILSSLVAVFEILHMFQCSTLL